MVVRLVSVSVMMSTSSFLMKVSSSFRMDLSASVRQFQVQIRPCVLVVVVRGYFSSSSSSLSSSSFARRANLLACIIFWSGMGCARHVLVSAEVEQSIAANVRLAVSVSLRVTSRCLLSYFSLLYPFTQKRSMCDSMIGSPTFLQARRNMNLLRNPCVPNIFSVLQCFGMSLLRFLFSEPQFPQSGHWEHF